MVLVYFKEIHDGRGGTLEIGQHGNVRQYTRVWRARTNNPYDNAYVVVNSTALDGTSCPRAGSGYPYDPLAVLRKVNPRQHKGKLLWVITGEYSSERTGVPLQDNPLMEPARIEWNTEGVSRPIWLNHDGTVISNTAGEICWPPMMTELSIWSVAIRKNLIFVPGWIDNYRNSVNSDTFHIQGRVFTAGQARMMRMSISDQQERNGYYFYTLTMIIQILGAVDANGNVVGGHQINYVSVGFNCRGRINTKHDPKYPSKVLVDHGSRLMPCTGGAGQPLNVPQLLDQRGYQIVNPGTDEAVQLTANIWTPQPYAILPLW